MPKLRLKRDDVQAMIAFADRHTVSVFFLAKDHGAYVGITANSHAEGEPLPRILHYFAGCDPTKDADFFDCQQAGFGGDDFGERFSVSVLRESLAIAEMQWLEFDVTAKRISISSLGQSKPGAAAGRTGKSPAAKRPTPR